MGAGATMGFWQAASAHAQTVSAALPTRLPRPRGVCAEPVTLPIPEGGELVAVLDRQPRVAPAVVVLHGVGGSSDDAYVQRASVALLHAGFSVLRLNQRGTGRGAGRARRLYHAGLGEDLALAVEHLAQRADVERIGALGFSLGGHVALRHAADEAHPRLRALATVSAPVDLAAGMRAFDEARQSVGAVYERLIVNSLLDKARALKRATPAVPFELRDLRAVRDIRSFDAVVTVPCNGFADTEDYWRRVSVAPHLHRVTVPTLMIHADDDTIVPVGPLRQVAVSRSVERRVRPRGGHIGFVDEVRQLWTGSGAVAEAVDFLRAQLR